jgi:hypothetical protein
MLAALTERFLGKSTSAPVEDPLVNFDYLGKVLGICLDLCPVLLLPQSRF